MTTFRLLRTFYAGLLQNKTTFLEIFKINPDISRNLVLNIMGNNFSDSAGP